MKKNLLLLLVIIPAVQMVLLSDVQGFHEKKPVTPYGDYCPRFSKYGKNKAFHTQKQAEEALEHYYNSKGFAVEIVSPRGRFIKAHVKKKDTVVDIIIFDRHTGRIRSIY
jgi:hypothetical protein